MHRSGTTFVGKILEKSKIYKSIHEPLNFKYGVAGNPFWYSDIRFLNKKAKEKYKKVLFEYSQLKFNWSYKTSKIVSRGQLDDLSFLYNFKKEVIIKDPFILPSIKVVLAQNPKFKSIIMVRHPLRVLQSIERMNWNFDFRKYESIHNLKNIYPNKPIDNKTSTLLLWNHLYKGLLELEKEFKNQCFICKHEDLCNNPENIFDQIYNFLEMKFDKKNRDYVELLTNAKEIAPDNKKQHNFSRNTGKMTEPLNVKKELHSRFLDICGETYSRIYGDV